jgi:hypothetical protein
LNIWIMTEQNLEKPTQSRLNCPRGGENLINFKSNTTVQW